MSRTSNRNLFKNTSIDQFLNYLSSPTTTPTTIKEFDELSLESILSFLKKNCDVKKNPPSLWRITTTTATSSTTSAVVGDATATTSTLPPPPLYDERYREFLKKIFSLYCERKLGYSSVIPFFKFVKSHA